VKNRFQNSPFKRNLQRYSGEYYSYGLGQKFVDDEVGGLYKCNKFNPVDE
jgi:hypothetical protein